jgi:hypothetical protein
MTKTKAQLRAEAVERLRQLNCMDVDCYQLLEATVDDAGEKVGYRVEISKLIDLLTDDAHESRGSYEERLHDVPVSDCPYCGCKRVVIHDFNDIYEKPHSYRVEHMDEKEAFNAGCFESYYSFDSAEKAVEHANMRDPLTDEPMDARRDNDGTCPIDDGTASNAPSGTVCPSENLDAQSRAEIEDAERSRAVSGDAAAEVDSGTGGTEKTPQEPRECARITFTDTREMLEADVRKWFADEYYDDYYSEEDMNSVVSKWLDRQAAITQDETIHDYNIAARESGRILRDEIAELKADNDCLRDRNEKLDYEVREWKGEAKTQRNNFEQATEARKHWQRKYENLKATSYSAKSPSDESELARELGKALAERDMYREKLGRAVDAAHEVVRMMEAER